MRYRVQEGIGSEKAPAPQATLMSLVTKGILTQQLPWGLVLLGVFTSILMEIIGVPALAFAVGMYLPLESTTPVFLGGLARKLVDRQRGSEAESDAGPGRALQLGPGGRRLDHGPRSRVPGLASPGRARRLAARRRASAAQALPGAGSGFLAFLGVAYLIYRTALTAPRRDARRDPPSQRVKIAFIGTHGVGKTTLCYDLAARAQAPGRRTWTWSRRWRGCRRCPSTARPRSTRRPGSS